MKKFLILAFIVTMFIGCSQPKDRFDINIINNADYECVIEGNGYYKETLPPDTKTIITMEQGEIVFTYYNTSKRTRRYQVNNDTTFNIGSW